MIKEKDNGKGLKEGVLFNKWLKSRLINHNQNVLVACTGPTGSGKSYAQLRQLELWYKYNFNKKFPTRNICFSVEEIMQRITDTNPRTCLRKGEILVLEEAGVNMGSLDFQQKVSKMFNYVLQSFRSMNYGIFMNLPVLSMLNKSARLLLHAQTITSGIDYNKKKVKLKPMFHQVNQQTGKVYSKYMRVAINGKVRKIKKVLYSLPSQDLIDDYERRKAGFLKNFTEDFSMQFTEGQLKRMEKMGRRDLTPLQMETWKMVEDGSNNEEICEKRGIAMRTLYDMLERLREKGYNPEYARKSLRKRAPVSQIPISTPIST